MIAIFTPEELTQLSDLLEIKLDTKLTPINHRLDRIENRLGHVENQLEKVEVRLDYVENRLELLEESNEEICTTVNAMAEWIDKTSRRVPIAF